MLRPVSEEEQLLSREDIQCTWMVFRNNDGVVSKGHGAKRGYWGLYLNLGVYLDFQKDDGVVSEGHGTKSTHGIKGLCRPAAIQAVVMRLVIPPCEAQK